MENNPKDILTGIESTLTASPSLVPATLQQIVLGTSIDTSVGYPFCRVYMADFASPVADTVSYERTYSFVVEIIQEVTNKSKRNAELDFANAVHAVLNRLQGAWQLGIGAENSSIESSPITTEAITGGAVRVAKIRLTVTTLIQNPS